MGKHSPSLHTKHNVIQHISYEYILRIYSISRSTIFYGSALALLGLKNISGAMVLAAMSKRRALG